MRATRPGKCMARRAVAVSRNLQLEETRPELGYVPKTNSNTERAIRSVRGRAPAPDYLEAVLKRLWRGSVQGRNTLPAADEVRGLRDMAGGFYGVPEAEYDLMVPMR
jgi:hypothetical protein